jgi:glycosyltransferase involved in cell wall biosynthesis
MTLKSTGEMKTDNRHDSSQHNHNLILITNHFPFGTGESFLESEIEYLTGAFDKVIVLARDVTSRNRREGKGGFEYHRINPQSNLGEKLIVLVLYCKHLKKVIHYISEEIAYLKKKNKSLSWGIIKVMVHDMTKALTTAFHIDRIIRRHRLTGVVTLYSYWLTSSALSTIFVTRKQISIKRIARAHGGDVYESRSKFEYLSYRPALAGELDRIFTVSENAATHLKNNIPSVYAPAIQVSRLGTKRQATHPLDKNTSREILLVSCSFILPVKRIHLIIDALACIEAPNILWIHFGDGPLMEQLMNQAREKLSKKTSVRHQFKGYRSNEDILKFYHENYVDLFLNASSSEGIPVTMMEAQSFGIPIVAPAVGGIPEIVSAANGRLFSVNDNPEQIAHVIQEILSLPRSAYQQLRDNAFRNWATQYNAEKNFPTFVAEVLSL